MKAILVTDMPKCCNECKCNFDHWCSFDNFERYINDLERKPKWCPLRPLPRKIDIKAQEDIDYQRFYENPDAKRLADEIVESQGHTRIGSTRDIYHAWNACHDEITGETE